MSSSHISRRHVILGAAGLAYARASLAQSPGFAAPLPARLEIERLVEDLKRARRETDAQRATEDALRRAVSRPDLVLQALGAPAQAGIHTIYNGDDLTILNVIWAPLMVLLPHNHNMWASIGIYTGREDNIVWEKRGASITATSAASLSEKDVFSLSDRAIHSVTNPIGRLTGAIHVYGGDFFAAGRSEWDAETLRERPWDLEAARHQFTKATDRFNAVP